MTKKLIPLLIVCFAVIFTHPAKALDENSSTITSSAMASMEVEPDTASFYAEVITEDKELKRAIEENNKKAREVYKNIKDILGDEGKIKTSNFSVNPIREYNKVKRKRELTGYQVSNRVIVETKNLDEIGKFLQTAIGSGANSISNLSFTVEAQEKYCDELLKQAIVKAKQKAKVIADLLDVKITGVKRVNSSCQRPPVRPVRFGAGIMSEKAADIPVESGEMNMRANVNIEFYIKNE